MSKDFIVTREWIEAHKSVNGGYKYAQIKILNDGNGPEKGWINRAIGKRISLEEKKAFEIFLTASKSKSAKQARKAIKAANRKKRKQSAIIAKEIITPIFTNVDPKSDEFLKTFAWRKLRMLAIKSLGNKCQCCGNSPENGAVINVDHIKPRKLFPRLALDINNLQILCSECNHGKGNWDQTDWRKSDDLTYDPEKQIQEIMENWR